MLIEMTDEEISKLTGVPERHLAKAVTNCGRKVTLHRIRSAWFPRASEVNKDRQVKLYQGWWHVRERARCNGPFEEKQWGPWHPYPGTEEPK